MSRIKALALLIIVLLVSTSAFCIDYAKNPTRAMLYSSVIPGGGQIYNASYIKSAAVIGLQGFLVATAINHSDKVKEYKDLMAGTSDPGEYLFYKAQRDSYREELKSDYWWMGTVWVLSIADAFVDAHLYNYKADKKKIMLKFEDKTLQMQIRF